MGSKASSDCIQSPHNHKANWSKVGSGLFFNGKTHAELVETKSTKHNRILR